MTRSGWAKNKFDKICLNSFSPSRVLTEIVPQFWTYINAFQVKKSMCFKLWVFFILSLFPPLFTVTCEHFCFFFCNLYPLSFFCHKATRDASRHATWIQSVEDRLSVTTVPLATLCPIKDRFWSLLKSQQLAELWDLQYQGMLACWYTKSAEWTLKHTTCSEEPQMTSFLSPLVLFTQAKGWNFSMIPSNQRYYSRGWTTSLQSLTTPLHARYAMHTFKWANFQHRVYPSF